MGETKINSQNYISIPASKLTYPWLL